MFYLMNSKYIFILTLVFLIGAGLYLLKKPQLKTFLKTTTLSSPSSANSSVHLNILTFQYPGSTIITSLDNQLTLVINENPDSITNWYKEKIASLGMNTTSFVVTKNNNNVKNELVGAGNNKEIRISIEKTANKTKVKIDSI